MAANSTAEADAIRAYLASEEEMDREEGIASHLPAIFRDLLLLAAPGTTPADAARRIHQAYTDAQLASDPLVRFQGDDGIAGFLDKLYELVFDLARFATYGAARQDLLVEVLLELRKLPASDKPQRIWDEECTVYVNDPVFAVVGEKHWNTHFPMDEDVRVEDDICREWANLSAFLARCTAAGMYDHCDDRFKYPSIDLALALEAPPAAKTVPRETRILVAALWILYAGREIYDDLIRVDKPAWNLEKWNKWEVELREVVSDGGLGDEVRSVVSRAQEKMEGLR